MYLTFGEIMMRVTPHEFLRLRQCMPGTVEIMFAGGEANVCASLAMLGCRARFLTALPRTPIAESVAGTLRGLGVDCEHILWRKEGRLGLYFVEAGANQRGSTVIYDRDASAVSLAAADEYDFAAALAGVSWLTPSFPTRPPVADWTKLSPVSTAWSVSSARSPKAGVAPVP